MLRRAGSRKLIKQETLKNQTIRLSGNQENGMQGIRILGNQGIREERNFISDCRLRIESQKSYKLLVTDCGLRPPKRPPIKIFEGRHGETYAALRAGRFRKLKIERAASPHP